MFSRLISGLFLHDARSSKLLAVRLVAAAGHVLNALRVDANVLVLVQLPDLQAVAVAEDPLLVALQGVEEAFVLGNAPVRRAGVV